MYMCGQAVQVSNLHPGAMVRVFLDGVPIGLRWAGLANSVAVAVSPALVAPRYGHRHPVSRRNGGTAVGWDRRSQTGRLAAAENAGAIGRRGCEPSGSAE